MRSMVDHHHKQLFDKEMGEASILGTPLVGSTNASNLNDGVVAIEALTSSLKLFYVGLGTSKARGV